MNRMVRYAHCATVRDRQMVEKKLAEEVEVAEQVGAESWWARARARARCHPWSSPALPVTVRRTPARRHV
jgi:hypothetical protein